jgi:hypothetical protein
MKIACMQSWEVFEKLCSNVGTGDMLGLEPSACNGRGGSNPSWSTNYTNVAQQADALVSEAS